MLTGTSCHRRPSCCRWTPTVNKPLHGSYPAGGKISPATNRRCCVRAAMPRSSGRGDGTCPSGDCRRFGRTRSRIQARRASQASHKSCNQSRCRVLPTCGLGGGWEGSPLARLGGLSRGGRPRRVDRERARRSRAASLLSSQSTGPRPCRNQVIGGINLYKRQTAPLGFPGREIGAKARVRGCMAVRPYGGATASSGG